ncbi:hypothetical protein [Microbacterium aurum]
MAGVRGYDSSSTDPSRTSSPTAITRTRSSFTSSPAYASTARR